MKLKYRVAWLHSDRPTWEMIWKKMFFAIDFHMIPEQRLMGGRIFSCPCISIKKTILFEVRVDPFTYNWNHLQIVGLQ